MADDPDERPPAGGLSQHARDIRGMLMVCVFVSVVLVIVLYFAGALRSSTD